MQPAGAPESTEFYNKPERLAELRQVVAEAVQRVALSRAMARELRGRIQFCMGHGFSRCGAAAARALGRVADGASASRTAVTSALAALQHLVGLLECARPHVVEARPPPPALLFTDGACEPAEDGCLTVTVGAVLYTQGGEVHFFGCRVGKELVTAWRALGSDQVIGQAEILPALLAKVVWSRWLAGAYLVCFIDNESAKFALMASASPVQASADLVAASCRLDAALGIKRWCTRVPSAANVADAPSRLDFARLRAVGAVAHEVFDDRTWPGFGRIRGWEDVLRAVRGVR